MEPADSTEIQDIQRRMAQIRHEMHEEVRGAVMGAQSLVDWRSAVRNRPWLSVGLAAAAGYVLVPKRRPPAVPIVTVAGLSPGQAIPTPTAEAATGGRGSVRDTLGIVFSLVAPVVVRAAQSYVAHHLENWLAAHPVRLGGGPSGGQSTGDGSRPAGPPLSTQRFREPG